MEGYKKRIFIRAIKIRVEAEKITYTQAIEDYPKLTEEEKAEILKYFEENKEV